VRAPRLRIALATAAAAAIAVAPAVAQSDPPPLITDRPSFTSAARVVGPRTLQIESGVSLTLDQRDVDPVGAVEFSSLELPNALVRLGLTPRLELRAAMIGWIRSSNDAPFATGASSALSTVDLAAEVQIATQQRLGIDFAAIGGASVPTQQFGSGDNTVDPFAQLVWGRDLTPTIDIGGMVAWSLPSSAGHRLETFSSSAFFGHPLGGAWSAFWELVGGNQDIDDGRVAWTGNFGVTRAIGVDKQLDAVISRGLDWAFGAGFSIRFRR
jgi:hypothetical protein